MYKISPEKIGEIKAHWKAGRNVSAISRITKIHRLTITKLVRQWEKTGEVKKGESVPIIEKMQEEKTLNIAARHGLTKEKVVKKVAEFMGAERKEIVKGRTGEDPTEQCLIDMVPDYKTQIEGTKMAVEILGMKTTEEKKADAMADFINMLGDL